MVMGKSLTDDNMLNLTAEEIRNQLKEIRVYILAHEGQKDYNYTSEAVIKAIDPDKGPADPVINYNAAAAGTRNYRWKIYTIIVTPYNLR